LQTTHQVAKAPLRETIAHNYQAILQVAGLVIIQNVGFYIVLTWMQTYITQDLGFSPLDASLSTTITLLVGLLIIPPLGALSDRIGRKPMLIASCVGYALLTYPAFLVMGRGNFPSAVLAHVVLGVLLYIFISTAIAVLTELFPARVRYGGFSIGYNISVALFGGIAPFLATWLIAITGNPISPAFYVIFAAIATLVTVLTVPETARAPLKLT
jgi:MHS family proline/betaine transporter-like MFS transporter